jgi:hypothetical protein
VPRWPRRACATATTQLPGARPAGRCAPARAQAASGPLGDDRSSASASSSRAQVREAVARTDSLDDVRRELRLGMGPCQGGFCMVLRRPAHARVRRRRGRRQRRAARSSRALEGDLAGAASDQLRQAWLDDWIHHGVLGIGGCRDPRPRALRGRHRGQASRADRRRTLAQRGACCAYWPRGVGSYLAPARSDVLADGDCRRSSTRIPTTRTPRSAPTGRAALSWLRSCFGDDGYGRRGGDDRVLPQPAGAPRDRRSYRLTMATARSGPAPTCRRHPGCATFRRPVRRNLAARGPLRGRWS